MKKIVRVLQTVTKKITSSKTNIQIVLLILILFFAVLSFVTQLPMRIEWNKEQEYKRRLEAIRSVKQTQKTVVNPSPTPINYVVNTKGYIQVTPRTIPVGNRVKLEYGYKDPLNNEHLNSAVTTVIIETPSRKKYSAISPKVYPDDFPGAYTSEVGTYWVYVDRKIKTTYGNEDILFTGSSLFFVTDN